MSIDVALSHITKYTYDRLINLGPQTIRLRPAPHTKANIVSYSLKVHPAKHFINWQQDPFSNYQARIFFPEKVKSLTIEVDLVTKIKAYNPFDFFLEESVKTFPFDYSNTLREDLSAYLALKETGPLLNQFVKANQPKQKTDLIDFLVNMNQAIQKEIKYNIRLEPGVQTPDETLKLKSGSCRDMAWLGCQVFRQLGLAARFCSGYLIQLKADVLPTKGPQGPMSDFTDLHAWVEVFLPGAGWIGLDPSSGLLAGEGHIPLSCTPTPSSAAPISGTLDPCESEFTFSMNVTRLNESPRSTKPYTSKQWDEIQSVGEFVDKLADQHDIRLTMGGEPTFISINHQRLAEWDTSAVGTHKESVAKDLIIGLRNKYSYHGLIQYSQGKWYPGEILPRWSYGCYWRQDKEPLYIQESFLNEHKSQLPNIEQEKAEQLLKEIAKTLGISSEYVMCAYEDVPYHTWKKQFHPIDTKTQNLSEYDLHDSKTTDKIVKEIQYNPVGYVLPLGVSALKSRWISCPWAFEADKLYLLPGNSPLGLRLPTNQLPMVPQAEDDMIQHRSFEEMHASLPTKKALMSKLEQYKIDPKLQYPNAYVRTALCTEIRDNVLYLFLPPLNLIEHYLELISAIEISALKLDLKIVIEGYPPPQDLRMNSFKVTPDPGVLEINIQPTQTWDQLSKNMKVLYEEARAHDLDAEKFLVDGRKVGTGGGNHIVLGAQKPLDSPFLRKPDLLKSMLIFWQNHPSLSYLFSSLFIGPTSQSPRVDEARHDSLYELEIAFRQIENREDIPYWQIDRIFRNILVDLTGNTHRSEFCIDKLYSPTGEFGRLGLLELRSFEMPPHYQMSALQYLLIKSLVTLFWREPYREEFRRFGPKLHDKYMLPAYMSEDFKAVIHYIQKSGINLKYEWFKPFIEFRFPQYGEISIDDLNIEIRAALEPWPVMGEESHSLGTSRAVDSSVERLQCKVKGTIKAHHIITCNGYPLPLHKLNHNDEVHVCGVRFKAWQLYSALHPNIPVHSPLTFDIYDTRHHRSLGGFKYHVYHPGGRSYDSYPINENEAQGRRLSRFEKMGHSAGADLALKSYIPHSDFPMTLDLRRVS